MLDYKLIEAIGTVISEGGFERAARFLNITQSAVSQRVKQLEEEVGQLLLIRTTPPALTDAGKAIMKHYQQVASLEQSLSSLFRQSKQQFHTQLTIGINDDSLATWFLQAVQPFLKKEAVILDLRVDDQEQTLEYLKSGEVMACLSSHDKQVQGCTIDKLGSMSYRLVANRSFWKKWFAHGVDQEALSQAPAVIFNRKDTLHHKALNKHFKKIPARFPCHYVPSSEQFVEFVCQGLAYGAIPDIQGKEKVESGELIELVPNAVYPVHLYWHCWSHRSQLVEDFTKHLLQSAAILLI